MSLPQNPTAKDIQTFLVNKKQDIQAFVNVLGCIDAKVKNAGMCININKKQLYLRAFEIFFGKYGFIRASRDSGYDFIVNGARIKITSSINAFKPGICMGTNKISIQQKFVDNNGNSPSGNNVELNKCFDVGIVVGTNENTGFGIAAYDFESVRRNYVREGASIKIRVTDNKLHWIADRFSVKVNSNVGKLSLVAIHDSAYDTTIGYINTGIKSIKKGKVSCFAKPAPLFGIN